MKNLDWTVYFFQIGQYKFSVLDSIKIPNQPV